MIKEISTFKCILMDFFSLYYLMEVRWFWNFHARTQIKNV